MGQKAGRGGKLGTRSETWDSIEHNFVQHFTDDNY